MRDLHKFAAVVVSVVVSSGAHGQSPKIERVHILERGIYDAHTDLSRRPVNGVWPVYNVRLSKATTNIPMRRHLRFGLRYVLQGAPHGKPATVELVTRYPAPGMVDKETRLWRTESRYRLDMHVGVPRYREFQFVEDEELVPGIWVFEFWQGGKKLGEQHFCVVIEDEIGHPSEKSHRLCHATTS